MGTLRHSHMNAERRLLCVVDYGMVGGHLVGVAKPNQPSPSWLSYRILTFTEAPPSFRWDALPLLEQKRGYCMNSVTPTITLKRPDKIVMGIIGLIVAVPAVYALTLVVPILLKLAVDMTMLAVMCVVLALILMVVLDKGVWTTVYYQWANISRSLRRAVARENPIGVMDTAIGRFDHRLEEIDTNLSSSAAALKRHESAIAE